METLVSHYADSSSNDDLTEDNAQINSSKQETNQLAVVETNVTAAANHSLKRPLSTDGSLVPSESSLSETNSNPTFKTDRIKKDTSSTLSHFPLAKKPKSKKVTLVELENNVRSQLEPARAVIDATTVGHMLNFEDCVQLLFTSKGSGAEKRSITEKYIKKGKKIEVVDMLQQIHGVVGGEALKIKLLVQAKLFNTIILIP